MKATGLNKKIRKDVPSSSKEKTEIQPPTLPEGEHKQEKTMPTQENCFGKRKYAEVVVETLRPKIIGEDKEKSVEPSSSTSRTSSFSKDRCNSVEPVVADKLSYFYGNPCVEKTTGILHFYRNRYDFVILLFDFVYLSHYIFQSWLQYIRR